MAKKLAPLPLSPEWLTELFIGAYVEELTWHEKQIVVILLEQGHMHKDAKKCLRPGAGPSPASPTRHL